VLVLERLPDPGEKLEARDARVLPGGQIATATLACARLGLRSAYVGALGEADAHIVLAPLMRVGVDVSGVKRVAGVSSRSAVVLVEASSGERTIVAHRPAGLALGPSDLERDSITSSRALLLDCEDAEASRWAAQVARGAGVPVVLDADRATPEAFSVIRHVDFPIVSKSFAEQSSSDTSPAETLRELAAGGATMAVMTRGGQGAVALHADRLIERPALPADVRDTTGAGDVFRAAFVWGILQGLHADAVLRAAATAAALSCRGQGAQGALPDRDTLEAELRAEGVRPGVGGG
jgi:sugar/nucleoside kinase (ribokinase family)